MAGRRAAATVAALLASFVAACGTGDDGTPEAVRDSAGSTVAESSTAVPATTSTTAAGTARTTTSRPATTTTRQAAVTTTVPAGARALTPPAPGAYRYDTAGSSVFVGTTVAFPAVTSLVVDPPSGTRQRSTRNLRDAADNGVITESTLDYRPEGVFLVSLRLISRFSGVTDVRDLQPASPVLLLATGARPGAHLEAELTGTSPAKLVVDVLGEERVTVGGQGVETLVVRAVVTLPPGDVTGRQELTLNLDRGSRLWVKERSVVDASAAAGLFTLHSQYTATLQRLTP